MYPLILLSANLVDIEIVGGNQQSISYLGMKAKPNSTYNDKVMFVLGMQTVVLKIKCMFICHTDRLQE